MCERRGVSLLALLLWGCGETTSDTGAAVVIAEPAMTLQFTIAAIADPHVSGSLDAQERLAGVVAWVSEHAAEEDIELVVISGDIAWDSGLDVARALLDELPVPYLPVIGDNEIQSGSEEAFWQTFADHYEVLAAETEDFRQAPVPLWNPDQDAQSWPINFSLTHKGVRLVALDWGTRYIGGILGEMADLHDFEGGTLRWLDEELALHGDGPEGGMLLLSHHPMHVSPGAFDVTEHATLAALLAPYTGRIWANLAGHYHVSVEETDEEAGYDVLITDAVWDDEITIRLVEVWGNGVRFAPVQREVVLEW